MFFYYFNHFHSHHPQPSLTNPLHCALRCIQLTHPTLNREHRKSKHQPIVNESAVMAGRGGSEHSKLELLEEAATALSTAETNANGTTATDIDTLTIPTQSWKQ